LIYPIDWDIIILEVIDFWLKLKSPYIPLYKRGNLKRDLKIDL